ncbi:MAG: FAD-binding oxidoreductase [Spirochaetota bacterium]|nr:MAG: FAD-binding oxidoreductase [Spirochaetota bacterium]
MKKSDVIVVGGGLAGSHTTFHLSRLGLKVILLERGSIACGASGRNGGQVLQCEGKDRDKDIILNRLKYTKRSVRLLKELKDELDFDYEFKQVGTADIVTDEEGLAESKELYELSHSIGDDEIEFLDWKGLHEVCPYFADFLIGGRIRTTDGNLNPLNLANGLVDKAKKYGAEVYTWHNVDKVVIESGKVKGVEANGEKFSADKVVLATSLWTRDLLPGFGFRIFPHRPLVSLSEPIPYFKPPAFEVLIGDDVVWGGTQTATGHLLVGGGAGKPRTVEEQYDYVLDWEDTIRNGRALAMIFTKIKAVNVLRIWCGVSAYTIDGLPLVGESAMAEGLYIMGGFVAGVCWTPICGKLLAELIANKTPEVDLESMNPNRFDNMKIELPEKYNYAIMLEHLGRL